MKRQNVRTLALVVCTFTYLLVGAAIFDAIESDDELIMYMKLKRREKRFILKYNITRRDFDEIHRLVIKMKSYRAGTQWKFAGAFYFALTVITTIGFGHSTPKTVEGKVFCMLYALPGIPLCIVMFQSIGERINVVISFTLKRIKKCCNFRNPKVSQSNLITVSLTLVVVVITGGGAVFSYYEGWDYINSIYYCFITLTTIGFGDFVALQKNNSLSKKPDYVAFSLIFILFGLTVVSSGMNLLVLHFVMMNNEDEKRDEIEAWYRSSTDATKLEGDVIVANGGIGQRNNNNNNNTTTTETRSLDRVDNSDDLSMTRESLLLQSSYHGGEGRGVRKRRWHLPRYTVIRSPTCVEHLIGYRQEPIDLGKISGRKKRSSI